MSSRVSIRSSNIFGGVGHSAPAITRIFVPRDSPTKALTPRQAQANSPDAIFARQSHDQLTAVRDAEAMQNLAAGHTEAFVNYAKNRLDVAATPQEKAYWQSNLDRAQSKLEDDTIANGVKAGTTTLEDVRDHLLDRASKAGSNHPDYSGYVKQIGAVNDAIKARDFNSTMTKAQLDYVNSPQGISDKQAYRDSLASYLPKATDPAMRKELAGQIDTLQKSIDTAGVAQRVSEASKQVSAAYDGDKKPHDVIAYLNDAASKSKTAQEAQWYANEAGKLNAFDRQQTRDAIMKAAKVGGSGGGGSTAALKSTVLEGQDALRAAATDVHSEIVRNGKPSDETWKAFDDAHKEYADALAAALPGATAKGKDFIIKEQARINGQYDTQFKEVGQAVVKTAEDAATQLAGTARALSVEAAKTHDYTATSEARYQWAQALGEAMNSPFVNPAQKGQLEKALTAGPLAEQAKDIQNELGPLRTDPTTGANIGSKVKTTQLDTQYDDYRNAYDNAAVKARETDPNAVLPPLKSVGDFKAALLGTGGPNGDGKDSTGAPLPDPSNYAVVKQYLFGPGAEAATWQPDRIGKFKDLYSEYQTAKNDERDNSIAAIVQLTKSHQPGLVDDRNIAVSNALFDPKEYGPAAADPNLLASDPNAPEQYGHGDFGPGSPPANAPKGGAPMALDENAQQDQPETYGHGDFGQDNGADITSFDAGSEASAVARMRAHMMGLDSLEEPTSLDLPNYSIPELPQDSPFAPEAETYGHGDFPTAPDAEMAPPPEVYGHGDFPEAPTI